VHHGPRPRHGRARLIGNQANEVAVDGAVRPSLIEFEHPVANHLYPDDADFRRLGARGLVVDRRKSQQSARFGVMAGDEGNSRNWAGWVRKFADP
jgi:hypothetical protein